MKKAALPSAHRVLARPCGKNQTPAYLYPWRCFPCITPAARRSLTHAASPLPHPPPAPFYPQRRLGIDPWLPLFTRIQPSAGYIPGWRTWGDYSPYLPSASPVDVPDSKYLADYVTQITKFPSVMWNNYGGPMMARGAVGGAFPVAMAAPLAMAAPAPAPAMANAMAKSPVMAKRAAAPANEAVASDSAQSGGGAGGAGGGGASLRLQSDFKVTPLFVVATTAAGGAAYIGLRAPPNLGRFEVRAYVASPANGEAPTTYGAGESEVIVRRGVSLLPSVPRIVRSGDSFEAGVIVTAPGEAAASQIAVTATITAAAGANAARPVVLAAGGASESKTVSVSAGGQEEVRFKFSAKQVRGRRFWGKGRGLIGWPVPCRFACAR